MGFFSSSEPSKKTKDIIFSKGAGQIDDLKKAISLLKTTSINDKNAMKYLNDLDKLTTEKSDSIMGDQRKLDDQKRNLEQGTVQPKKGVLGFLGFGGRGGSVRNTNNKKRRSNKTKKNTMKK